MSQQRKANASKSPAPASGINKSGSVNSVSKQATFRQTITCTGKASQNESTGPVTFSGDSFAQMSGINCAPEDDTTAEVLTDGKKNVSDLIVNNSSRSVRERKKRSFEEFHTFDSHARNFQTSTPILKTSKKTFITSTPLPEIGKRGRGRPKKLPDASSVLQHFGSRDIIKENGNKNYLNEDSLPSEIIRRDSEDKVTEASLSLSKERLDTEKIVSQENQSLGKPNAEEKTSHISHLKICSQPDEVAADSGNIAFTLQTIRKITQKSQTNVKNKKGEMKTIGVMNDEDFDNVRRSGRPRKKRNYAELAQGGADESSDTKEEQRESDDSLSLNPGKEGKRKRKGSVRKENDNFSHSAHGSKDVRTQAGISQEKNTQESFEKLLTSSVESDVQIALDSNKDDADEEGKAPEFNRMEYHNGDENVSLNQTAPQKSRGRPRKSDQSNSTRSLLNSGIEDGGNVTEISEERESEATKASQGNEKVIMKEQHCDNGTKHRQDMPVVVAIKKRGRPPKNVDVAATSIQLDPQMEGNESSSNKKTDMDEPVQAPPHVRKRGRPPKSTNITPTQTSMDLGKSSPKKGTHESTSPNNETAMDEDDLPTPVVRKRGRPKKNGNDESELSYTPAKKKDPLDPKDIICKRCGEIKKSIYLLQRHMMIDHSLWWTKSNPMGVEDTVQIIKALGYIECKKCRKRFRFAQYYRHHQIWCGRESEIATCEVCNHQLKAMWLQQHLAAHKKQEKIMMLAAEEEEKKGGEEAREEEEEEVEGREAEGKRRKRKAAKSAIKLLNSFQKDHEDDKGSSGDEFKGEGGDEEESSDDDDDDEGEDEKEESEAEETGEDGEEVKGKKKKEKPQRLFRNARCTVDDPNTMLALLCSKDVVLPVKKRLKALEEIYSHQSGPLLFPELCPRKKVWKFLSESEAKEFLPTLAQSTPFTGKNLNSSKNNSDESVLKFGESVTVNGKSYSFTGNHIWSIEWCPLPEDAACEQIVAVSTDKKTKDVLDSMAPWDGPGNIQLWGVGSVQNKTTSRPQPKLLYCIAHEGGQVNSMSWCPRRCFDEAERNQDCLKRLGLLAVACSNGSVLVYSLPQPTSLLPTKETDEDQENQITVFQPPPCLRLVPNSLNDKGASQCLTVSWQQTGDFKYVLAGYGHGTIYMWDLLSTSPLIKVDSSTLRPLRCFKFHNMAVFSAVWNPRLPNIFATSSFDSTVCMWDANSPDQPISILRKYQNVSIARSLCWAGPINLGIFGTSEKYVVSEESPIFYQGLARSCLMQAGKPLLVLNHTACVWDVSFCPYYDVLYTCDATGKVKVTLPPMADVRAKLKSKNSWYKSQCASGLLYQARIKKNETKLPSEPTKTTSPSKSVSDDVSNSGETTGSLPDDSDKTADENLGSWHNDFKTENTDKKQEKSIEKPSQASSKITPDIPQAALEDFLEFADCKMEKGSVRSYTVKSVPTEVVEQEDFGGNNINAIYTVRPNPHPSCCLWLASGGQSGLLRFDNLSSIVQPHYPMVKQFYAEKTDGKS